MSPVHRVALLGFSAFERSTLASYFRLASTRQPHYQQVQLLPDADFVVADADHAPSVQLVRAVERMPETVFVGARAPEGAIAWLARPIDPLKVLRELDVMAARRLPAPAPAAPGVSPKRTVIQPARPQRAALPALAEADDEGGLDLALPVTVAPHGAGEHTASRPPLQPLAPPAASAPARAPGTPPSTALLVDDSNVALQFLRKKLAPYGLITDCVSHSEAAVVRMSAQHYDFVFLDMELGAASALDGLGLCAHIKREAQRSGERAANVVMVTAHHTELDRVRGSLAGCDGFLGKPLDDAELALFLSRHGLRPAANAGRAPS